MSLRLSGDTLERIDNYAAVLNMSRSGVIEVMLRVFMLYAALNKSKNPALFNRS
jgi:predicted transcriptional regulator